MQLKPYPEYKKAEVSKTWALAIPWLKSLPITWSIERSKRLFSPRKEKAYDDDYQLSATQAYGVISQQEYERRIGRKVVRINMHLEKRAHVEPDDFVISMRSFQGGLERAWVRGCIRSSYVILKPSQLIHIGYFAHLFKSQDYISALQATSNFIRDGQDLNFSNFCLVDLPLPPQEEQEQIGRFLDWKSAQINKFIRNKRRLIELLKEKKQHIINQAVTRGIDPNVKLKPSGVVWIGDIPEHWKLCRLRNVVSSVTSGSRGWSQYAADDGPLFIRIANLCRTSLDLRFDNVVRLNLPNTSEIQRTLVQPGDILVSITAYIGSIAVAPDEFETAYVSQHVARCSPLSDIINSRWLGYVLLSNVGQFHGQINLYGGTKDGLSLDDVKSYPVLLPPKSEQDVIVKYIQDESQVIDQAITRTQREIELMREYRSRLIADVVTGQVDVRGIDVPEVAEEAGTNEYSPLHDEDTADADDWLDADEDLKAGE